MLGRKGSHIKVPWVGIGSRQCMQRRTGQRQKKGSWQGKVRAAIMDDEERDEVEVACCLARTDAMQPPKCGEFGGAIVTQGLCWFTILAKGIGPWRRRWLEHVSGRRHISGSLRSSTFRDWQRSPRDDELHKPRQIAQSFPLVDCHSMTLGAESA